MDKDYSIYKYYKGSEDYPNDKARFFGFYEQHFDVGYRGKPEDKEEAFKDYTLSNIGLYDSTKKYKIYIIEEEDIFLIEIMESEDATNNIVLDSEDNIILSIEKRIL